MKIRTTASNVIRVNWITNGVGANRGFRVSFNNYSFKSQFIFADPIHRSRPITIHLLFFFQNVPSLRQIKGCLLLAQSSLIQSAGADSVSIDAQAPAPGMGNAERPTVTQNRFLKSVLIADAYS